MQRLVVPQGDFLLARHPPNGRVRLRAWDAADEYLLHHLHAEGLPAVDDAVLILNDNYGALSVALAPHRPQALSDSHLTHRATVENLKRNNRDPADVRLLHSLQEPEGPLDLVLFKVPKNLAFLADLLHLIRPHMHSRTRLIGAGMVRDIHTSTLELCERIIGPTRTSLAQKKARLICCRFDPALAPGPSPYPTRYALEDTDLSLINHANLFSRESLDIGTRLFLAHIPSSAKKLKIVDLGCGNGVLSLIAATRNPAAELVFVDESFQAIASARANFAAAFGAGRKAVFHVGDGLEDMPRESVDLVLNNPPFHQQRTIADAVAWRMFHQSRIALKKGGELRVVGNRHLGYHAKLGRLFGHCEVVASNRKFVILRAVKG